MKYVVIALLILLVACGQAVEPEQAMTDEVKEVSEEVEEIEEPQETEETEKEAEVIETKVTEVEEMNTIVKLETNQGVMKIKLYDDEAPKTVGNFKKLVSEGFYDGTIFHRVIKDFMIQGGDPTGTGMGGPGYKIDDEFGPGLKHDKKGILSMANSGPNTGGSQFFITLAATPWLDGKHAIFGEIVEGQDVLEKIGTTKTAPGDKPVEEIKMGKATIV